MEDLVKLKKTFKGKRVLITGNTGFKGSWLGTILKEFLEAEIVGFSNKEFLNTNHFKTLNLNYKTIYGDIRNLKDWEKVLESTNPDLIIHLAAQSLVFDSYTNPSYTFDVNTVGVSNLFQSLLSYPNQNVKGVVVVTSDKCYKNDNSGRAFSEEDCLGGYDPYSASKACSEIITNSYRDSFSRELGVLIASVRSGNVIGGGDFSKNRLIPDIVKAGEEGKVLSLRSPESTRPWQHVLDPLFGYLHIASKLLEGCEVYATPFNLGPELSDCIRVKDVVNVASKVIPHLEVEFTPSERYEASRLELDITKLKDLCGFSNLWNSKRAIEKTLEWYGVRDRKAQTFLNIEEYLREATIREAGWII